VVNNSERIVFELRGLTSQIRALGDILVSGSSPAKDLRCALREVNKTYRAVNTAILRFITPVVEAGAIDPRPFLEMERGTLRTEIQNGRGHCGLILTHHGRYGGLRDWIKDKLSLRELEKVDAVFAQLGTADGDLFRPLEDIGDILSNESRVIANLLLVGQDVIARQRIRDGRVKLGPLEDNLSIANKSLVGNKGYRRYLKVEGSGHFVIDENRVKAEERYDGIWVLRTNSVHNSETVAHVYKALWTVEDIFRTSKSILETRPIYHKRDETIRGHVLGRRDRVVMGCHQPEWAVAFAQDSIGGVQKRMSG
jgi:hypothetical protein